MAATTAEPRVKKPPKLFHVTGDAQKIHIHLSSTAIDRLLNAIAVLKAIHPSNMFPKASALASGLQAFLDDPTAKAETKP